MAATVVTTEHAVANDAIAKLRELRDLAIGIKQLGDENVDLKERLEREIGKLGEAEDKIADLESEGATDVRRLCEAIADFDRGIMDREELITLGRELLS